MREREDIAREVVSFNGFSRVDDHLAVMAVVGVVSGALDRQPIGRLGRVDAGEGVGLVAPHATRASRLFQHTQTGSRAAANADAPANDAAEHVTSKSVTIIA